MSASITLAFHGLTDEQRRFAAPHLDPAAEKYVVDYGLLKYAVEKIAKTASCTVGQIHKKESGAWSVLSFDDGLISDYEIAFPLFVEFGIKATFFITANNIGKQGYLSWQQVNEMSVAGMEIGSHGLTHSYLSQMSDVKIESELIDSKSIIEQTLGVAVDSFAPVGGHFQKRTLKVACQAGYKTFATMIPGVNGNYSRSGDMLLVRRNHLQNHHDQKYVDNLLRRSLFRLFNNRVRYEILDLPKKLLGLKRYDQLKNRLVRASQ